MSGRAIFFVISVIVAFIGGIQFSATFQKPQELTIDKKQCYSATSEEPFRKLSYHVAKTSTTQNQTENEVHATQREHSPEGAVATSTKKNSMTLDLQAATSPLKASSENFDRWMEDNIERDNGFDVGNAMHEEFSREERDYSWAGNEEDMLSGLFYESQHLEGLALHSVECRSTQCQLQIAVSNLDQANETTGQLLNALAGKQEFRQLVSSPDVDNGITTFYLSRDTTGLSLSAVR